MTIRTFTATLLLLLVSAPLLAQSVVFETGHVAIGDSVALLLKIAGKPERVQPFPGQPELQCYEYFTDGRNITVDPQAPANAESAVVVISPPAACSILALECRSNEI